MENRWSYDRKRNYGAQARSMTIRFYFKVAVQFVQALAHSGQTHTRFRVRVTESSQCFHRYAASAISYLKHDRCGLVLKADADLQSSRVAVHVRQALLQHTEKSGLDRDWQSVTFGRQIQPYVNPTSLPKPSTYHCAAELKPASSNNGGCSRYEVVRISWSA